MRKITVEVKVTLTINADEGVEVGEILDELAVATYNDKAEVEDSEVTDYEVKDSK